MSEPFGDNEVIGTVTRACPMCNGSGNYVETSTDIHAAPIEYDGCALCGGSGVVEHLQLRNLGTGIIHNVIREAGNGI